VFDNMKRFARAQDTAAIDAVRLGDELRASREATGVSLEEMATRLRIRRVYLLALEEGRLRDLPSAAYAIGFVRNYAGALGLDASDTVRRFREAVLGQGGRKTDLVFPEPVPERGFPAGVVVLLGTVIAIGSYVGWYSFSGGGDRVVDAVPQLPPRLESTARDGEALRAPPVQGQAAPSLPPCRCPPRCRCSARAPRRGGARPHAPARRPEPHHPALQGRGLDPGARPPHQPAAAQPRDARGRKLRRAQPRGLLLSTGSAQATEVLVDGQVSTIFNGVTGVRRDIRSSPTS
jgi:cytoskeleton protein RodZ